MRDDVSDLTGERPYLGPDGERYGRPIDSEWHCHSTPGRFSVGGLLALVVVVVALVGVLWVGTALADTESDCPTEDSCTADYRDGGWVIEPDVP
jgi:hypothetical protein